MPGLKKSLVDPVPEVRSMSARALGAMVRGIGEQGFDDLQPWLMETLTSDGNTVNRCVSPNLYSTSALHIFPLPLPSTSYLVLFPRRVGIFASTLRLFSSSLPFIASSISPIQLFVSSHPYISPSVPFASPLHLFNPFLHLSHPSPTPLHLFPSSFPTSSVFHM